MPTPYTTNSCPFCASPKASDSYLEDTWFNNKLFKYRRCQACDLVYIQPFPEPDDYMAMYPTAYQSNVGEGNSRSYSYIFDLIKPVLKGNRLLDYGCGGGQFVVQAQSQGLVCAGTEYNPAQVEVLKKNIPTSSFYSIDEFWERSETYDVIFLSNVLEHLTNPVQILNQLVQKLNPGGLFVAEGPLEENFNIAYLFRKLSFAVRKKLLHGQANHPPVHIFRANARNQREFFQKAGLSEIHFNVNESHWPFPHTISASDSLKTKLMYYVAQMSVAASRKKAFWGNDFLYVGQVKL